MTYDDSSFLINLPGKINNLSTTITLVVLDIMCLIIIKLGKIKFLLEFLFKQVLALTILRTLFVYFSILIKLFYMSIYSVYW